MTVWNEQLRQELQAIDEGRVTIDDVEPPAFEAALDQAMRAFVPLTQIKRRAELFAAISAIPEDVLRAIVFERVYAEEARLADDIEVISGTDTIEP